VAGFASDTKNNKQSFYVMATWSIACLVTGFIAQVMFSRGNKAETMGEQQGEMDGVVRGEPRRGLSVRVISRSVSSASSSSTSSYDTSSESGNDCGETDKQEADSAQVQTSNGDRDDGDVASDNDSDDEDTDDRTSAERAVDDDDKGKFRLDEKRGLYC